MSSHLLNEVAEICDEVAMIDHGKLIVYDKLSNVTQRFSHDGAGIVEAELMRDVDDQTLTGGISSLDGVLSVERIGPRNFRMKISGGQDRQARILADIAAMNIGLISFRPSSSTLEDTYLNLIKDTL